MAKHGKRYGPGSVAASTASGCTRPLEAIRLLKEAAGREVRRDRRDALQPRPQRPARRPAAPGTLMLPHGTGREMRVAVFAEGEKAKEARGRGRRRRRLRPSSRPQIEGGFDDFDIASPRLTMMGVVGKLGRILGPRGKMPNPKAGTVTFDVGKAVREAKAGKLEYRTDRGANVHLAIGKKSFDERAAARELRGRARRDRPRQAVGRQGPLHPVDHASRRPWGPGSRSTRSRTRDVVAELEEAARGRSRTHRHARRRRQPAARDEAEVQPRRPNARTIRLPAARGPPAWRARCLRGGEDMLKSGEGTDRRRARRAAADIGDADRRRLPRVLPTRSSTAFADRAARARRPASRRQEHAHAPRGGGGRNRTRCSSSSTGPTAIAFVHDGDMVAVAKTLDDTARTTTAPESEGRRARRAAPIGRGRGRELATLPPADVLRGQVLGAIVGAADRAARPRQAPAAGPRRPDRRPDRAARRRAP